MIIVKPGASLVGLRPGMLDKTYVIDSVFNEFGVNAVVTSGTEQYKHSVERSAHYRGDAVDWRSKHLETTERKHACLARLREELGADFVVLFEGEGQPWEPFHTHWSPVYHGESQH